MAESKQSEKFYLERFGVTDRELLAAMGRGKVRDVDYADLYFEHTVDESISMEESLVKRASKSISQGVGVRATEASEPARSPLASSLRRPTMKTIRQVRPRMPHRLRVSTFESGGGPE